MHYKIKTYNILKRSLNKMASDVFECRNGGGGGKNVNHTALGLLSFAAPAHTPQGGTEVHVH